MRRLILAAAATFALSGTPAWAQTDAAAPISPTSTDTETYRRCAGWATMLAGQVAHGEVKNGVTFAAIFFLGRYEGASGKRFETSVTGEDITKLAYNSAGEIEKLCVPLMDDFGARMGTLAKQMQDYSPEKP